MAPFLPRCPQVYLGDYVRIRMGEKNTEGYSVAQVRELFQDAAVSMYGGRRRPAKNGLLGRCCQPAECLVWRGCRTGYGQVADPSGRPASQLTARLAGVPAWLQKRGTALKGRPPM